MDVKQAYNIWSDQYDTNNNKTRDLETIALRTSLADNNIIFEDCLEMGCGTGKNTKFLKTKAKYVTSVDLSDKMLAKAKQKINSDKVQFIQADITQEWVFLNKKYDLVVFSLVLEHIENLNDIFKKISNVLSPNGIVYIGELHPFKQYTGTKARFDTEAGQQIVTCFNHNISDFVVAAKQNGLELMTIQEYFDDNDRTTIPRILALIFIPTKNAFSLL